MKKLIALVLALAMVALCIGAAVADENDIIITVSNDTEKAHTYYAYQIFSGNVETLNGAENLTNIEWGSGVTATSTIISELGTDYSGATSAADVARILGTLSSNAEKVKAFANVVASHLSTVAASAALNTTSHTAALNVTSTGAGYYLVKEDTNATLDEGESFTKILLKIIHSQTIVAKDTHLTPEKKIVEGSSRVDANNAAIGNDVEYEITLPIPNTLEYNRYKLEMNDTLSSGLTFKEITSIQIAGTEMILNTDSATTDGKIEAADLASELEATNYYASLSTLTSPAGAHKLSIVFKDFKSKVEQTNAGVTTMKTGNVVIRYKATVNKDAIIATTGNPNTVDFDYSNNPNNTYDGDKITQTDPHGTTPDDTVKTYVAEFDIKKVDGTHNNSPLAGAEFSFVGTEIDTELLTGTKFVASDYSLTAGEETYADTDTYYKLVDGTYTTTAPTTTGIDTSKYATPTTNTYRKINYSKKVLTSSATDRTVWSGTDGYMKFTGLKANATGNHYTLTEETAPAGYNKLTEPISITIIWTAPSDSDTTTGGFTATAASTSTTYSVTQNQTTGIFEITVQNNTGTTLPSTGGIGTTIFYIVGGLLVIGAAVILVARRKAHE